LRLSETLHELIFYENINLIIFRDWITLLNLLSSASSEFSSTRSRVLLETAIEILEKLNDDRMLYPISPDYSPLFNLIEL